MPFVNEPTVAFADQNVGDCTECDFDGRADVIQDTDTGVSYWRCPDCGAGQRRDLVLVDVS